MKAIACVVVMLVVACDKPAATTSSAGSAGSAVVEDDDEPAGSAQSWKVGDVVQVKREKRWYEAEVVTAGATYKVIYTFADTVEDNVDATRMRKPKWAKKSHVEAQVGDAWKRGTVVARNGDSYDIALDGGATQTFAAAQVRGERKPKTSSTPSTSAPPSNANAPCVGDSYMKRCDGVCTNTRLNFNNCGSCGHRCSVGWFCDANAMCRDKNGDL